MEQCRIVVNRTRKLGQYRERIQFRNGSQINKYAMYTYPTITLSVRFVQEQALSPHTPPIAQINLTKLKYIPHTFKPGATKFIGHTV